MARAARRATAPITRSSASSRRRALKPAAHLTCVGAAQGEVDAVDPRLLERGRAPHRGLARRHARRLALSRRIRTAIAPPPTWSPASAPSRRSRSASRPIPRRHPDSPSFQRDIDLLKEKIDAGATRAITQFAFESELFVRLRDRLHDAGIDIPLVPGLMPTTNFKGVARMMADAAAPPFPIGWRGCMTASKTTAKAAC